MRDPRNVVLSGGDGVWTARFRAMGGPCEVLVETGDHGLAASVAAQAAACAWRIEDKFSRYRSDTIVARINSSGGRPVDVDEETGKLIDFAALMNQLSDGMFDITSGVLRHAWTFDGRAPAPRDEELAPLLALVGWRKVSWEGRRISLLPGMQIDLGGIGKEYAVDQAAQSISRSTVVPTLINFGGDLAVTLPRAGDQPWRVGVETADPTLAEPRAARMIELLAGALATSGDTHRYITVDGQRLPHILDPRDGRPVRGAPRSVTVAAPTCTNAGMLSTLAMLKGAGAEKFLADEGVRHWIQR